MAGKPGGYDHNMVLFNLTAEAARARVSNCQAQARCAFADGPLLILTQELTHVRWALCACADASVPAVETLHGLMRLGKIVGRGLSNGRASLLVLIHAVALVQAHACTTD